jgi:hypothetical protein
MAVLDSIDAAQWLRANSARTRSGLSPTSLNHLALAGRIRVLALPGLPIRYHGDDCDAIRRELAGEPAGRPAAGA